MEEIINGILIKNDSMIQDEFIDHSIYVEPISDWYCELNGSHVIYQPLKNQVPNWFHR